MHFTKSLALPEYSISPFDVYAGNKPISNFIDVNSFDNVDHGVVDSFGEEWSKFNSFNEEEIIKIGNEYFDILPDALLSNQSRVLDMGCGTGRWTKYLCKKVGFIDAVDPSKAIFAADKLLIDCENVRLTRATSERLPFQDNTFDMVMSIGVLHHIPDTLKAMKDCVSKVKPGGYFYTYLYYKLDNRGLLFRSIFYLSTTVRKVISTLPQSFKKLACDILAVVLYLPFVLLSRFFYWAGLKKISEKIPLSGYRNKSFYIIRNDALDRFGTTLEQRFSKEEITNMLLACNLTDIHFSDQSPYWHVIATKK